MPPLHPMDPKRGRSGRPWRRLVKELCRPGSVCARCGGEIVFGLRANHPDGPSLDHITSLELGGHPTDRANLQPMHFGCNASKGAGIERSDRTSEDW